MKITKKEVAHITELARLSFSGKEMELFTEQLNQNQIEPSLSTQKVLFNAPQSDKDMVTVPRII